MQRNGKAIEMRPVARLKPFERNARVHSPEQIAQIAKSIREFGFTAPILVSPDGEIRAGHARFEAAKQLGLAKVPTVVIGDDWTPEQARAYVIADNQLALNAGWDMDLLRLELGELKSIEFDLSLTGFAELEIAGLFEGDSPLLGAIETPPVSRYSEQYGVIVICTGEQDQKRTYQALISQGFKCRVVTT